MGDAGTPDSGRWRAGVRRRWRWWIIGLAISAVALSLFASWRLMWFDPGKRIEEELARIRAMGEPVTPDDLDAFHPSPSAERDTTKLWLAALSKISLPTRLVSPEYKVLFIGDGEVQPLPGEPWPEIDVAQAFLEQQSGALALLYQVARREGTTRYPVRYHDGGYAQLPHVDTLWSAANLLRLDARVRAHRGDAAGSARSIRAILAAGRTLEREPCSISQVYRLNINAIAIEEFRALLPTVSFSDKDLASLQDDLRGIDYQEGLYRAMVGDRVIGILHYQQAASLAMLTARPATIQKAVARVWAKDDLRLLLESTREQVAAAKLPWVESAKRLAAPSTKIEDAPWFRHRTISMWPASYYEFFQGAARGASLSRSAAAAGAVERFRHRKNRPPTRLDDLVPEFLPAVPQDPFTGGPLRYKLENDAYVIYSLGPDLIDNDGDDNPRDGGSPDIVFRVKLPKDE